MLFHPSGSLVLFEDLFHGASVVCGEDCPHPTELGEEELLILLCFDRYHGTWWGQFSLPLSFTDPAYTGECHAVCGGATSSTSVFFAVT